MPTRPLLRSRAGTLLALALAPLAACSSSTDPNPCEDGSCVESIRISALRRYLVVGDTTRVTGEVTSRGSASTAFTWRAEVPNVATVDANGLVTARALGRGFVTMVPTDEPGLTATVLFDVVSGDTSAVPVFTGLIDPRTLGQLQPGGEISDSVDVTLEYVSGRQTGQAVTGVQLRLVGSTGKDTTIALTPAAGTGILRTNVRVRFGAPAAGEPRALPAGLYAARAILQLQSGASLQTDVGALFTAR